jgi:hypothetical protein
MMKVMEPMLILVFQGTQEIDVVRKAEQLLIILLLLEEAIGYGFMLRLHVILLVLLHSLLFKHLGAQTLMEEKPQIHLGLLQYGQLDQLQQQILIHVELPMSTIPVP